METKNMKLKLAEYKDGKFESFWELGKDFAFCGDYILLCEARKGYFEDRTGNFEYAEYYLGRFNKDEKDPLNRFDGLFDGRTYGNGSFVLILGFELEGESFYQDEVRDDRGKLTAVDFSPSESYSCCYDSNAFGLMHDFGPRHYGFSSDLALAGNLHENPELWEKVK